MVNGGRSWGAIGEVAACDVACRSESMSIARPNFLRDVRTPYFAAAIVIANWSALVVRAQPESGG